MKKRVQSSCSSFWTELLTNSFERQILESTKSFPKIRTKQLFFNCLEKISVSLYHFFNILCYFFKKSYVFILRFKRSFCNVLVHLEKIFYWKEQIMGSYNWSPEKEVLIDFKIVKIFQESHIPNIYLLGQLFWGVNSFDLPVKVKICSKSIFYFQELGNLIER